MSDRLRIVVTGLIGQHPMGGVTWDYLQYVLGLARLGHDVYYLEDSGEWPYNRHGSGGDFVVEDCRDNLAYLGGVMERFGLADRWAFRCPIGPRWFGLTDARREEVLATADLLLNVSGTLVHPHRYRHVPRLAYLDSDPVFTQIKLLQGETRFRARVDLHDVHFTLGETLAAAPLPATGHTWIPTRQPICLEEWATPDAAPPGGAGGLRFTTVMNWASYDPVEHDGRRYGQKDVEFRRFLDLPGRVVPARLEVAVKRAKRRRKPIAPLDRLRARGWEVVDPMVVSADIDAYRAYIRGSAAEWSVAKNGYVAGRPGWFSCRSACYLAAGRPVVVQDTGFAPVLPTGEGIVVFADPDEAAAGIADVLARYDAHARAAREIAREYFDAARVLGALVEQAMTARPREATAA